MKEARVKEYTHISGLDKCVFGGPRHSGKEKTSEQVDLGNGKKYDEFPWGKCRL